MTAAACRGRAVERCAFCGLVTIAVLVAEHEVVLPEDMVSAAGDVIGRCG